jgi:hypothetical protein
MKLHQVPGEIFWHLRQLFSRPYPTIHNAVSCGNYRKVVFFKTASANSGAIYLRHSQLADVFSNITDVEITDNIGNADFKSIVIGTKGTLDQMAEARYRRKGLGPVFLYDPVDELINPAKIRGRVDGVIASSYNQYAALAPIVGCPVYCILHHVDFRITRQYQKNNGIKFAYFGSFGNAYSPNNINKYVDFIQASKSSDTKWFNRLENYSCHYCVRRKREKSHSYKPSTKLYLAACVGAVVITTRDESDAGHILPPDYPFFLESRTPQHVFELIEYVIQTRESQIFERARRDILALRGWDYSDQVDQARYLLEVCI